VEELMLPHTPVEELIHPCGGANAPPHPPWRRYYEDKLLYGIQTI
jgi:hypothetical protein